MLIGKEWEIKSDSLNVILSKKMKSKKTGKEYWHTEGYFATIQNALKFLADYKLQESDLKDLKAITKRQDEIYQLIQSPLH